MALKRNERYPGRFDNPSTAHPQGAFKNRTSPTAQDGSYLESDWANDWDGFFARILNVAGVTPNGNIDTGAASQLYDALLAAVPGRIIAPPKVFLNSGTYTPTAGTKFVIVRGIGGGGAGGGAPVTASGNVGLGAGGNAGAYGETRFTIDQIGASLSVTIGAGGIATTSQGGNGGNSSFGALVSFTGGAGGSSAGNTAPPLTNGSGAAVSVVSGDANIIRGAGALSLIGQIVSISAGYSGAGANTLYGAGGGALNQTGNGIDALGYGAGGSGGLAFSANATARLGGNGSPGFIIVTEYS